MAEDTALYGILLNVIVLLPLFGAGVVALAPAKLAKYVGLTFAGGTALLSWVLYAEYVNYSGLEIATDGFVFQSVAEWFGPGVDIKWMTGVDGINIYLVLLTTLLFPLAMLYSWAHIRSQERGYYALLLLLMTGILGTFVALDLILFYVFFEIGLIPAFYLIGLWGGRDRRFAGMKFFIYTLVGSFLMLAGILTLGFVGGEAATLGFTSDWFVLKEVLDWGVYGSFLFWAFAIGFMVKTPLFPLHAWQPNAYDDAPTAGSALLAGLMSKMGAYGFIRFSLVLFPVETAENATVLATLAVVGILYGGMVAAVQFNLKRLIAFSSLAHMGFIVLGIFSLNSIALNGAVLQMVNHGITTAALFFLVGALYDRRQTADRRDYRGLAKVLPGLAFVFMLSMLASVGLPGLNGFVGEFLILTGAYQSAILPTWLTIAATFGVVIAAVYLLWMFRDVMFGTVLFPKESEPFEDLRPLEYAAVVPLVLIMVLLGVHAAPLNAQIEISLGAILP